MLPATFRRDRAPILLFALACQVAACGGTVGAGDSNSSRDGAAGARKYAITARIAITPDADGQHVTFPTQNGSTVTLAKSDLVGKTVLWGTAAGGDIITNGVQIDKGKGVVAPDLTSVWITPAHYEAGPWEVAAVISVSGVPPPFIPAAGDLGTYDTSTPPPGDPPSTGLSLRVHITDADATVVFTNHSFIRLGFPK